jgi:hypothetical protein
MVEHGRFGQPSPALLRRALWSVLVLRSRVSGGESHAVPRQSARWSGGRSGASRAVLGGTIPSLPFPSRPSDVHGCMGHASVGRDDLRPRSRTGFAEREADILVAEPLVPVVLVVPPTARMRRATFLVALRRTGIGALGGAVGGLVGTGLMIGLLVFELASSGTAGGVQSTAFGLTFGGAAAGVPASAPDGAVLVHLWHGVALGALGADPERGSRASAR